MFFRKLIIPASLFALTISGCATTSSCESECAEVPVPNMYPLGAISQTHYDLMQANAEAADFCIPVSEFQPNSTNLTAIGRDHVLELSARMQETPFPVLVEPSSDDQLNTRRRQVVAQVLSDLGNQDAEHRTVISTAYSSGMTGKDALRLAQ